MMTWNADGEAQKVGALRPLPNTYRTTLLVLLAYAVVCAFIFRTVLNNRYLLYGTDTVTHDYLMALYGWGTIRLQGIVPLWHPHLFGGIPFLGSFAFCPFYPTELLSLFIPFPLAFNLQYCVNAFLAACFMYFFCRTMGLARHFSFFGGLMFLLSGHFLTLAYPGHLQKFEAIVWMPAVLGFLKQGMARQRLGRFVAAGFALGMQLLAGHVQIAFYTMLVGLAFCAWLALGEPSGRTKGKRLSLAAGGLAVMTFVAGAWSGVQMLPGYEMSRSSNRAAGVSYFDASQSSYPPWEMIETVLPRFTGDSLVGTHRPYWGAWGERLVSDYAGIGVWVLAVCALIMSRRRERFLFAGLFCVAALLAMGRYSPLFWMAYHWFPGFSRFRSPAAIMVVMSISLAYLSGVGLEAVLSNRLPPERRTRFLRISLVLAGAALLGLGLIWMVIGPYFQHSARAASATTALLFYQRGLDVLWSARHILAIACVVFALLSLYHYRAPKAPTARLMSRTQTLVLGVFVLACSVDLYLNDQHFIQKTEIEPFSQYLFHTWSDDYLEKEDPPIRMLDLENLLKNRMVVRRISTLHGYHPIAYQKYFDLVGALGFTSPAFAQLYYLRFLIAPEGNAVDNHYRAVVTRGHQTLYVYSASGVLPQPERTTSASDLSYAYFPEKMSYLDTEQKILAMMKHDSFSPYKTSYALGPPRVVDNRDVSNGAYGSRVILYKDNRVEIETHCPAPSWCVTADYAAPGWQALLDGSSRLPIVTANYFFRMVRLPAGTHNVVFIYQPFSFRLGLYLTGLALAGGIVLVIGARRRDRAQPKCFPKTRGYQS